MLRSVAVTIAGQKYTLRSDASEEYVRRLARLVEERLRQNARAAKKHSTQAVAVLTALQLADALSREQARREGLRTRVRQSLQKLRTLLGERVSPEEDSP